MHPTLKSLHDRTLGMIERVRDATSGMDQDQLNEGVENEWSVAQVLEHMRLTHQPYLEAMETAIATAAPATNGPVPPHLSWFGKSMVKMSGPGGNAPAPKRLHPAVGFYGRLVVEDFARDQRRIANAIQLASQIDLNKTRFRNPFLPLIKMRVSDALFVLVEHGERHVRQIEERAAAVKARTERAATR